MKKRLTKETSFYCSHCGQKGYLYQFRLSANIKEWSISGLCQKCQDRLWGRRAL